MDLFYNELLSESQFHYELNDAEAKHINRVLRKSVGDALFLTNGKGLLGKFIISSSTKTSVSLKAESFTQIDLPKPRIHLWLGMMHTADRLEFALEKVTELGVYQIHLVKTKHSQPAGAIKKNRLEQKVLAALKQSQRVHLPTLNFYENFPESLTNFSLTERVLGLVAHEVNFENRKRENLIQLVDNFSKMQEEVHLFIGPEGGFHDSEVSYLIANGCSTVSLGEKRLRAETAAILGIGILSTKLIG